MLWVWRSIEASFGRHCIYKLTPEGDGDTESEGDGKKETIKCVNIFPSIPLIQDQFFWPALVDLDSRAS